MIKLNIIKYRNVDIKIESYKDVKTTLITYNNECNTYKTCHNNIHAYVIDFGIGNNIEFYAPPLTFGGHKIKNNIYEIEDDN